MTIIIIKPKKCGWSDSTPVEGAGVGVHPYIGYIGMCRPKGFEFRAVLV